MVRTMYRRKDCTTLNPPFPTGLSNSHHQQTELEKAQKTSRETENDIHKPVYKGDCLLELQKTQEKLWHGVLLFPSPVA